MACKLDVDESVQNLVQRTVKNIGTIKDGVALVTKNFSNLDLDAIKSINEKAKEKLVTYTRNDVVDLPGKIVISISEKLYKSSMAFIQAARDKKSKKNKPSVNELNEEKVKKAMSSNLIMNKADWLKVSKLSNAKDIRTTHNTIKEKYQSLIDFIKC